MNSDVGFLKSGNKGFTTVTPAIKDWLGLGGDNYLKHNSIFKSNQTLNTIQWL